MLSLSAVIAVTGVASLPRADAGPAEKRREVQQKREQVRERLEEQRGELNDTEQRLETRRGELDEIERELEVTVEDVERLDRRITELDEQLAQLEDELGQAEDELAAAEQRLDATTAELVATEEKLNATRTKLAEERQRFAQRSRASFVHGGDVEMMTKLLDAADVSEFSRSVRYVEAVLAEDRARMQRMAGLKRQIEATKEDLEVLQERRIAERAHAETQRDKVARLVAEQEELRAEVAAEREQRRQTMLALEADRESHEKLVDSLEQASDKIETELAELAEREEQLSVKEQRLAEKAAAQRRARERARREAERARREAEREAQREASGGDGSGGSGGSGHSHSRAPSQGGRLQRPSNGPITSSYGYRTHPIHGTRRMHTGVDMASGYGAPIFAAEDGVVVSASHRGGYGQTVVVNHGGGLATLYAHQSRFAVRSGQRVNRGQVLGYEGASGAVTGAHLHFEVRVNGRHRDPMPYLR